MPSLHRFLRRRVLIQLTTAALCVGFVWLLVAVNLFVFPSGASDEPPRADAVVVLAGASSERLPVGLGLLSGDRAPVLALSATHTPGNARTDYICTHNVNPRVMCFSPEPMTTRGEARAVARLARDNGWRNIIVVTSSYHVARAGLNLEQCSSVDITLVASQPDIGLTNWMGRFVEETGGIAAGFIRPACANPV
ncbi:YdcF family protein [Arthrobacter zhangbolii]|uniref:YdcF family protein n=1 Tax=Arthrobacter zhangbolii TaxID=2886936 RepID=A0A9X1M5F5_9MICC|nr:YdcF family protein [Arthrobacter zhangbolii]MCC3271155.1 YdcF family protein [Arthrobacter zhangbolii]UON91050.1 YdcF family protein [Arthrobacter zhangbolii]